MKNIDQVIGYLEAIYDMHKQGDGYWLQYAEFSKKLLKYIKNDENKNEKDS